jgi:hypothetical protein
VPLLLSGDETDMEWHAAFEFMDRVCIRSGYRSEGRIPTNAEQAKRALENYLAANSSVQTTQGDRLGGLRRYRKGYSCPSPIASA